MVVIQVGDVVVNDNAIDDNSRILIDIDEENEYVMRVLYLLGYDTGIEKITLLDVIGLGDLFILVLDRLIAQWDYMFQSDYPVRYIGLQFSLKPFVYINKMEELSTADLFLVVMYGQYRNFDIDHIRTIISDRYLCDDQSTIRVYRYVQYMINHPRDSIKRSIYSRAYMLQPSSAPYQGERDLLLRYIPSADDSARITGLVYSGNSMDIAMNEPIISRLYKKRLLSNAMIAGGSISSILTRGLIYPESDIDIFVYGNDKEYLISAILQEIQSVYGHDMTTGVSGSVIYIQCEGMRPVQIVSSSGKSADDILFNFDFSHICVGLDNRGFIGTPAFFHWSTISSRATVADGGHYTVPIRYILRQFRIEKIENRGYIILHMDRSIVKGKSDTPPVHNIVPTSSIEDALAILNRDGKFRNDLESEYSSSIHSISLGLITILSATMSIDTLSKLRKVESIVYKTESGDIRLLFGRINRTIRSDQSSEMNDVWAYNHTMKSLQVMILDTDLLILKSDPRPGEIYEMINTPSHITLVKKKCQPKQLRESQ